MSTHRYTIQAVIYPGTYLCLNSVALSDEVIYIKELDPGTTRAIFHQASRYISEEELRQYFYAD